jgi:hypothetical protein
MSFGSLLAARPRVVLVCQVLGLCIFAVAFVLPAVRDAGPVTSATPSLKGWECAKIAISATFQLETYKSSGFLVALSGLINPMILLYLGFNITPKFKKICRLLAVANMLCMAATWTYFALEHLAPLIGHFLWIAGALLILAAEVVGREKRSGDGMLV